MSYSHSYVHEGISVLVMYCNPLGYYYSLFRHDDIDDLYSSIDDDKFYPGLVEAKAAARYYIDTQVNVPF